MELPEGITQNAWDEANEIAAQWQMPGGEDHDKLTEQIARAIDAAIAKERAKIEADVAAIKSPSEYSNSWHLGFRAGREAAVDAIRKGA